MNVIRLSVSPRPYPNKIAQGDNSAWADLYRSLVHVELDATEIASKLYTGHVIGPVMDGWRSYDHFVCGQHIGIDMDTEDSRSAISTLIDHDLVQMYGAIIHSTPSSTPSRPRTRLIFLLDQPIHDPRKFKIAIRTLSRYFAGFDRQSAEATRTFFGNARLAQTHNVDGIWVSDSRLPLADLRKMYEAQRNVDQMRHQPAYDYTGAVDVEKLVRGSIAKARDGNRNGLCYWMACRMVETGVSAQMQEQAVRQFAANVPQAPHPFPEDEALACLRSARTGA